MGGEEGVAGAGEVGAEGTVGCCGARRKVDPLREGGCERWLEAVRRRAEGALGGAMKEERSTVLASGTKCCEEEMDPRDCCGGETCCCSVSGGESTGENGVSDCGESGV